MVVPWTQRCHHCQQQSAKCANVWNWNYNPSFIRKSSSNFHYSRKGPLAPYSSYRTDQKTAGLDATSVVVTWTKDIPEERKATTVRWNKTTIRQQIVVMAAIAGKTWWQVDRIPSVLLVCLLLLAMFVVVPRLGGTLMGVIICWCLRLARRGSTAIYQLTQMPSPANIYYYYRPAEGFKMNSKWLVFSEINYSNISIGTHRIRNYAPDFRNLCIRSIRSYSLPFHFLKTPVARLFRHLRLKVHGGANVPNSSDQIIDYNQCQCTSIMKEKLST